MSKYSRIIAICMMMVSLTGYAYIKHEVKRGETLWGLSHKYNVSPNEIKKLNPKAEKGLKTGMILTIPEPGDDIGSKAKNEVEEVSKTVTETEVIAAQEQVKKQQPQIEPEVEAINVESNFVPDGYTIDPETDEEVIDTDQLYSARFGDTLKSIAKKTGIDEADLIRYNPLIAPNHLAEGYKVRLTADSPYEPYNQSLSRIDSIVYRVQPELTFNISDSKRGETTIAIMLPFDLDNDVISQKSLLATEFYKGFLIATQEATKGRDLPLRIIAVDTQCDSIHFENRLDRLSREQVDIIIPPDDENQLSKIENFALENNIVVFNVLNIKDEGYLTLPNVVQCNISQKQMYDKAIQALLTDFSEYTPVILDLAGGKDEKISFIDQLTKQYESNGKKVVNLSFKNKLEAADLKNLTTGNKYIFIPKSGTSDVFNKISDTLTALVEEDLGNETYAIFGYPDWIAFRGEQEEALHRMGANIYSRFYYDTNDFRNEDANEEYSRWFGGAMEEVFPSQGLLGYDAGNLLYKALKNKYLQGSFTNKLEAISHEGVQSAFKFTKHTNDGNASGLINDSLYIIEYLPGEVLYVKVL